MRFTPLRRAAAAAGAGCILLALLGPTATAHKPGTFAPHKPGTLAPHKSGTWQSRAPLPEGVEGASTANVGNLIVAAYGFTSTSGDSNATRIYNIAHDSWSFASPAPGPASSEGIAVSHGGSVYALGGRNGAGNDNNRYTPATDTWTTLAPMPTARDGLGAAVLGKSIYAIGGRPQTAGPCSGGTQFATVERYDIASDTWSAVAALPSPRSDVGAIAHGGRIYVFGGCQAGTQTVTDEVDVYNPRTDSWSQGTPMPTARAGFYGIGIKGNRIYVIGGLDGTGAASPANEVYDIAHDSWSTDTPMEHPRGEMGVASHGGRIYTIGGGIPAFGTPQSTVDVFKP
jgi:N-acetylneuraminic acid mutarotase